MKKIAILGGGENQLSLITAAKNLGYYVVLIDFRDDIQGKKYADVHFKGNTTSYEEVLAICKTELVDGVVSNSEYSVEVCNKVAEILNLPGNCPESINFLMSKTKFREIQKQSQVFSPRNIVTNSFDQLETQLSDLSFPIIIKPCECSGTRGTTKFETLQKSEIRACFNDCMKFSRNSMVVVEEYVSMPSLTTIEGDIFIYNGNILWDGLFYTTRSELAPMVPMTYSGPLNMSDNQLFKIKESISKTIKSANITFGEFNVEGYFTYSEDFFIIEINARQGGHDLPFYLHELTSIDYNKLLVSTSVGDSSYWSAVYSHKTQEKYCAMHTVFSYKSGVFDCVQTDEKIDKYITRIKLYKKKGDVIERCKNGSSMVALVNLTFPSREEMDNHIQFINNLIKVKLM